MQHLIDGYVVRYNHLFNWKIILKIIIDLCKNTW
jgi:hypothetical protein